MDNSSNHIANSQHHNRYSYALNNPLKYTDPSGYAPAPILWENRGANAVNQYALAWHNQNQNNPFEQAAPIPGWYYYAGGGVYLDSNGEEVSFNEVFDNYIVPNSTFRWKRSDANNQKERQGIEEEAPRNENVAWDPNTWVETVGMSYDPGDEEEDENNLTDSQTLAYLIRNSILAVIPGSGIGPGRLFNPFYMAVAFSGDIGFLFVGAEGDVGGAFILAGKNAGEIVRYKEFAGGGAAEFSLGLEFARIDYTGEANNFKKSMLFGPRTKVFFGAGEGIGAGVGVSWSEVAGGFVITTSISLSFGFNPFFLSPGFNVGTIDPF